jgi:hypothetical protein
MSGEDLRSLLQRKAALLSELHEIEAADAKIGLTSRSGGLDRLAKPTAVQPAASVAATPVAAVAATAAVAGASSDDAPQKPVARRSMLKLDAGAGRGGLGLGSLLLGTLRGAQKDSQSQTDAAKRRAELESKVERTLETEQANSIEAKRKKLQLEAHEIAEKAARLETVSLESVQATLDAQLAPFRKTTAVPVIYWCKAKEVAALREAELQRRAANVEPGEEVVAPVAAEAAIAPAKRKRSESPAAQRPARPARAATPPPETSTSTTTAATAAAAAAASPVAAAAATATTSTGVEAADDDDLDGDVGEALAIVFE